MKEKIKEYLLEKGIKSEEQLAVHIIELKRNTVVPKIMFELVDLLVNNKDCLLSFFAENKLLDELFKRETVKLKQPPFLRDDFRLIDLWTIEKPLGEDLSHWLDNSYLNQDSNTSKEAHQAWQDRWVKTMTGEVDDRLFDSTEPYQVVLLKELANKIRQEKCEASLKTVLDDIIKDDVIFKSNRAEKETMEFLKEPYKETEGKLFYELDWDFVKQMAERMASNKENNKYDLWNWKKSMSPKTFNDLKQATMRHLIEVMEGRYEDDGRELGHIEAISTNMMMINYQLKLNKS